MKYFYIIIGSIFLFYGCNPLSGEKSAEVGNPIGYVKDGISFSYPGNWSVTEDAIEDDVRLLFVESPGEAIFIVQVYKKEEALSLEEFAESFTDDYVSDSILLRAKNSVYSKNRRNVGGSFLEGIGENISISILGLDVPHTIHYFAVKRESKVVFLLSQSADEDLALNEPGFNLIYESIQME